jgi:RNA polymerase sigma factor (TIGR02999 family)
MNEVTRILCAVEQGDAQAARDLLPIVYEELRKLAAGRLANESPGQTLQATALVHEAFLRLVGEGEASRPAWQNRGHFFAAAAEAMRRILIDRARARRAQKRGGGGRKLPLDADALLADEPPDEILELDEALTKFAAEDPVKAELVKLRFFAGISLEDAAAHLGTSSTTADRYWAYARAWLYQELKGGAHPSL